MHAVATKLTASWPATRLALMVGGTDVLADLSKFREQGGNIVIGTPGRLDDVMTRLRELSCKELELLVLDEARNPDFNHCDWGGCAPRLPRSRAPPRRDARAKDERTFGNLRLTCPRGMRTPKKSLRR